LYVSVLLIRKQALHGLKVDWTRT